ncbi:hypothetical protein [uncultured Kordia sp.]|uniref:hypothetical protein n=1 Tax=uncultured Kordia sp. TaxID=507699 RepID=UPI00263184A8|nr:hypothetical protein [uncultured Kordia sp.]
MASVPQLATYTSSNGAYQITITAANSSKGSITATYNSKYTPVGSLSIEGDIGGYSWVTNDSGDLTPFAISFSVSQRPSGRPYYIIERWSGYYTSDNVLVMTGIQGYVNGDGTVSTICLGTFDFTI